jgi:hypothetical protein
MSSFNHIQHLIAVTIAFDPPAFTRYVTRVTGPVE